MGYQYTLNQLINAFSLFASGHTQVNAFYCGEFSNYKNADKLYPLLFVNPHGGIIKQNEQEVNFQVMLLDRVNELEQIKNEVKSDMLQIAGDLKAYLERSNIFDFRINNPANFDILKGSSLSNDNVAGVEINFTLRCDWNADICSIPGLIIPNAYQDGTQSTQSPVYLSCENILSCSNLIAVLETKQDVSGVTPAIEYNFTTDKNNNLLLNVVDSTIDYSLNSSLSIDSLHANNTIDSPFIQTGSLQVLDSFYIENGVIISGGTDMSLLFASINHQHYLSEILNTGHTHSFAEILNTAHTHSFTSLTSTAHTHSISDITNLSSQLATKANVSGNTSFSSTTISASTYVLGSTKIEQLLGNDISGFRIKGTTANRFHAATRGIIYNSLTVTANRIYLSPFPVPRNINIDTLSYYVSTAVATSAIRLGIYGSDSNFLPSNLIVDAGSATTVSNSQLITFNINVNLTGNNLYWIAFVDDGAVNGFAHAANAVYSDVMGVTGNFGIAPTHFYQTATNVASLPTTITSINFGTGAVPIVQFRIT